MYLSMCIRLCSVDGTAYADKIQGLEQKLYRAQEELMELHRKKGEVCVILISCCTYKFFRQIALLLHYEIQKSVPFACVSYS
jgi:hypothetical protein